MRSCARSPSRRNDERPTRRHSCASCARPRLKPRWRQAGQRNRRGRPTRRSPLRPPRPGPGRFAQSMCRNQSVARCRGLPSPRGCSWAWWRRCSRGKRSRAGTPRPYALAMPSEVPARRQGCHRLPRRGRPRGLHYPLLGRPTYPPRPPVLRDPRSCAKRNGGSRSCSGRTERRRRRRPVMAGRSTTGRRRIGRATNRTIDPRFRGLGRNFVHNSRPAVELFDDRRGRIAARRQPARHHLRVAEGAQHVAGGELL